MPLFDNVFNTNVLQCLLSELYLLTKGWFKVVVENRCHMHVTILASHRKLPAFKTVLAKTFS